MQTTPPLAAPAPLSFARLFAALGLGVALVTLVLVFAAASPVLDMTLSGLLVLAFVAIVFHEVGRLLDDEGSND